MVGFQNVDVSISAIKKQEKTKSGQIIAKKRGRPRKLNMVKKLIKVDKVLYRQLSQKAEDEYSTIAAILARAIKRELSQKP